MNRRAASFAAVGLLNSLTGLVLAHTVLGAPFVVVTALGNIADTTPLPVSLADVTLFQKRIQGAMFGQSNPNWDILRQLELYRSGVLKLDELVTKTYSLDEIQQGYQDMHDGKNIRGVLVHASS